jgi:transposase
MENAGHAFLDAVRKSMRQVRAAVGSATINPNLLTAAERIQYDGYLRREDTNAAILKQAETGVSIKEIVRLTGHSRGLVRRVLRGQRSDVFRVGESSLEHHLPWLDGQWAAGHRNGADLWRCLKARGFRGSVRVVTEWATRRRRAETPDAQSLQRVPSARTIARLMTNGRDMLSKSETVTIAAIEHGVHYLASSINAVDLKDQLGDVETDCCNRLHVWPPPNRGGLNSAHIHGTRAPVEEPSTASLPDIPTDSIAARQFAEN